MNLNERLKELNNNNLEPTNGLWYDLYEQRLKLIDNKECVAFLDYEVLENFNTLSEDFKKNWITETRETFRTIFADVFYSGWEFNQYLRTGNYTRAY